MRIVSWRPVSTNSALAGFAAVELDSGLRLLELPVFACGRAGPWVSLPRRPSLDQQRCQRIGVDGKPVFEPVAEWRSRELADKFGASVLELLRQQYPGALA